VASNLPTGWSSKNCCTDSVNSRPLYNAAYIDGTAMTEESCISFCGNKGHVYEGVEYSQDALSRAVLPWSQVTLFLLLQAAERGI
jgi:hypothetical protein